MAVVCGRCSKLGSHRKSTNLEGGSGVNRLSMSGGPLGIGVADSRAPNRALSADRPG
jgi:hypothetical protein